ncbi:hypothetical protein [Sphingomonas sp. NBWT7]|nr:hypothetical protein [Sphingomonas sp. NBWT7]
MLDPVDDEDDDDAVRHREDQLDEALAESFPASDPLPLSLPAWNAVRPNS